MFGDLFLKNMLVWRWEGWRQDPLIKIKVQGRAKCSNLRGISGCLGAAAGPWACNNSILDLDEMGRKQKDTLALDVFMGGLCTSIVRRTKQNAATIGVSLVILAAVGAPMTVGMQYAHPRLG